MIRIRELAAECVHLSVRRADPLSAYTRLSLFRLARARTVYSWVAGTEAEALLELDYPSRAVFASNYATASSPIPVSVNRLIGTWYNKLAKPTAATQFALVGGGAAGDPASLGVAWLMATANAGLAKGNFKNIASREVAYLTKTVPKASTGAISHRPPGEKAQLWSVQSVRHCPGRRRCR